jgi:carboxyl-terminal processing protease
MKIIHVVAQKRISRLLGIHVVLVLSLLVACNSPQIQKASDRSQLTNQTAAEDSKFESAWYYLQDHYVDPISYHADQDTSLGSLLARLDPYSYYLSKKQQERFDANIHNGSIVKFGFNEWMKNDTPFVYSLNSLSVCKKEGLCIGDKLLALDTISLLYRSQEYLDDLFDSCNSLYYYTLTILRPGEQIKRSVAIRKCALPGDARFCSFMLDSATGYLWFNKFDEGIAAKVESTLTLTHIGNPKFANLIIDLRWNSGGLVSEAISLLSLFYATNDPVMEQRSEFHRDYKTFKTSRSVLCRDLNLIVLINENSYSAAELVAGTLQDWDRALIIGQQSGGKGLVMQDYKFPDGSALYFACGRYFLPSGRCVQIPYRNGIQNAKQPESDSTSYNLIHTEEKQYSCNAHVFYTKSGRPVYDQMGIIPDVFVSDYSTKYALGTTTSDDRFFLEFELVDRYQKLLLDNSTFESFVNNFPMKDAAQYIGLRVMAMREEPLDSKKATALTRRIISYLQGNYYGLGTQTTQTLKDDNLIIEARRILTIDAQNLKREIAANTPKEHLTKSNPLRRTKKLAVK